MACASVASAQLKVAILPPVDKDQNVNYGIKLLLRSSLTSAISNTPGYEGYDRVDMASIAGEQEFQRTGNVSDDQIKQLGVATGAAYVLVAEAAKYDATSIIITAKIIDVETFGVKASAVEVSGTSAEELQNHCAILAAKLLGVTPPSTSNNSIPVAQAPQPMQPQSTVPPTGVIPLTSYPDGTIVYVATQDEPKRLNHDKAIEACACKGDGWRLPTSQELDIINDNKSTIGGINSWIRYWCLEERISYDMMLGRSMFNYNVVKLNVRCVKQVKQ